MLSITVVLADQRLLGTGDFLEVERHIAVYIMRETRARG